ncbi:hypothetical protein F4803DRAFT_362403 [Xylaria telfairii]|nr:hypothetical protein F4803DRAFT_362403 [Xylaria telfairii]
MPSLMPLRRSARDFVNEVRAITGAGDEGRDSGSSGSGSGSGNGSGSGSGSGNVERPEPSEARDNKSWQDSTKRAFLRSLITTSKAKLGSRREDNNNSGGGKSGHDAEKAANGTCYFPPHHTFQSQTQTQTQTLPSTAPNPRTPTLMRCIGVHGQLVTWPPTGLVQIQQTRQLPAPCLRLRFSIATRDPMTPQVLTYLLTVLVTCSCVLPA